MIPVPAIVLNQITFPLQLLASKVASLFLVAIDVPVLRQGNIIQLPATSLDVAEACSGIRSLFSLATLSIIFCYLFETRIWIRVLLVLSSIPTAVLVNSLRIFGTGLLVQYWDPVRALGFFHTFSGWLVFLASLGVLVLLHKMLRLVWPQSGNVR
jgi:exosortase